MKKLSWLLVIAMLASMLSIPTLAESPKWSEITLDTDFKRIINENGAQLSYSEKSGVQILEEDGYAFKDLNRNGKLDVYEDWRADVEDRVADLLSQMSMDMKLGMLANCFTGGAFSPIYPMQDEWLYSKDDHVEIDGINYRSMWYEITNNHVTHYSYSATGTPIEQLDVLNAIQEIGESASLGIPISFETDRPYNTWGSMINMPYYAFGVAHDPELLYEMVAQYSKEMNAMGYTTIFHSYGVEMGSWYGDEVNNIAKMIVAETRAYEENGVNAMTKHYIARGGRNSFESARSAAQLWENFMVGWRAAVQEGKTSTIMMNNGMGLNNTPILYDSETIGYLRNELGFDGVLVTDWPLFNGAVATTGLTNDGRDLSTFTPGELFARMLECGIDQFGVFRVEHGLDTSNYYNSNSFDSIYWPDTVKEQIELGKLDVAIVDKAISRALRAKFNLGLFEDPYNSREELLELCASDAYKAEQFELTTVEDIIRARTDYMNELDERLMVKSTVLMKNDGDILPLAKGSKVFVDSNAAETREKDSIAIGAYATVVENMDEADVIVLHMTALDDAYEMIIEDAQDAQKPIVLVVEGEAAGGRGVIGVEPGSYETANCAAILMQTYNNLPDHGTALPGFYRYCYPSVTADMLFGVREPSGKLVYEIARDADAYLLSWGDLQYDMGLDDTTRLYLAAAIRENPSLLVPDNLGDVLYTANFGMKYNAVPDVDINTLVVPTVVQDVEEENRGSMRTVRKAVKATQKAGVPFDISFIVKNNGDDTCLNADVYDGDQLIASKFVSIAGGQFRVVTIELTLDAGEHTISISDLSETIVVE
ncbi:glycoside hydrolase family 3 N-terminal domain-containing protein [Beduinella massiliensis]|uniref:glycoside hydrolase family 3 N-terminal domain-containing protein n=1 Tax=Beduinella massiliensis TaxID=1852363 RepID=UPI000C860494